MSLPCRCRERTLSLARAARCEYRGGAAPPRTLSLPCVPIPAPSIPLPAIDPGCRRPRRQRRSPCRRRSFPRFPRLRPRLGCCVPMRSPDQCGRHRERAKPPWLHSQPGQPTPRCQAELRTRRMLHADKRSPSIVAHILVHRPPQTVCDNQIKRSFVALYPAHPLHLSYQLGGESGS